MQPKSAIRDAVLKNVDPNDFTNRYNTKLSASEEREFQEWAIQQGRQRDTYDYDLRGAWKELRGGTMTEDQRGHLGDKYKKPNHITFSTESKYSTEETKGGTWSRGENGRYVYTPSKYVLRRHGAERLRSYFNEYEKSADLGI